MKYSPRYKIRTRNSDKMINKTKSQNTDTSKPFYNKNQFQKIEANAFKKCSDWKRK